MITVPYNPKQASTEALKQGLLEGFSFTFYDQCAATELLARGERAAVERIATVTPRRMAKAGIRRALKAAAVEAMEAG